MPYSFIEIFRHINIVSAAASVRKTVDNQKSISRVSFSKHYEGFVYITQLAYIDLADFEEIIYELIARMPGVRYMMGGMSNAC